MGEIKSVLGYDEDAVIQISAKLGLGVPELLEAIVARVPAPKGDGKLPLRALIFDSHYDPYKGVVAYLRVADGNINKGDDLRLMGQGTEFKVLEAGYFAPAQVAALRLDVGDVGYVATGLKSVGECRVGDTVTLQHGGAIQPLIGYHPAKAMVFAGIYPTQTDDYHELRGYGKAEPE